MLSTMIKLGQVLSQDRNVWEDITDIPNVAKEREKGMNLYVGAIIFDIDNQDVKVEIEAMYEDESRLKYKNVRIQGGNNKAVYLCVEAGKVEQIRKSLFGKEDATPKGEFIDTIDKEFPQYQDSVFYQALQQIFALKEQFLTFYAQQDTKGKPMGIEAALSQNLRLTSGRDKVVLWCVGIICSALNLKGEENGAKDYQLLYQVQGYEGFVRDKFLERSNAKANSTTKRISYASGEPQEGVCETDFTIRYSINKMFVKETKNFASMFVDENFEKNYQLSADEQKYLERASEYLLRKQQIKIAEVNHCIIPQIMHHSSIDMQDALVRSFNKSEMLFETREISSIGLTLDALKEEQEIYWLNYVGFESDGNFFKTINIIKDVNSAYLGEIIETFYRVNSKMKEMRFAVPWEEVMKEWINKEWRQVEFNLATIYKLIPQRKDKEKKNEALAIFKSMLEKRKISRETIFHHFTNLILCYYYPSRQQGFKNVRMYSEDSFDFAVRDSVFKYLAFIKVFETLKLVDTMDELQSPQDSGEDLFETIALEDANAIDFRQSFELFFEKMNYTPPQKAMFFLGRMLSTVAYIQRDKKKTVLEKVNFNGLDKNDIIYLRTSLIEKAQQYKDLGKVIFDDEAFARHFNANEWNMPKQEALFFALTGYSFGIKSKPKDNKKQDPKEASKA